jgi:protein-ribulosamine 3-kinase
VTLPSGLKRRIELHTQQDIVTAMAVGGGCISNTARLELAAGDVFFLKWASTRTQPINLFQEEAKSLEAIATTHTVRVPQVIKHAADDEFNWLLLEWLEPGGTTPANQAELGRQLAELHRHSADYYGWSSDNFIGSLPQSNQRGANWPEFWRERRLRPQLELAGGSKLSNAEQRRFHAVLDHVQALLDVTQADGPSLLHGDLWNGNMHMLADGSPALIDPSCYYGHREVDLAMARLFGGFTQEFYRAYQQAWPCQDGWEQRLLMYQLYYLLVHVNLFGGGYVTQTMSVVERLGA